jgi:hypothetical protein
VEVEEGPVLGFFGEPNGGIMHKKRIQLEKWPQQLAKSRIDELLLITLIKA